MPLMKCEINGQSGWKFGSSGKCYIGEEGKQKAIKQALAEGKGKMPEDSILIISYVDQDIYYEDEEKKVMGFIPPPIPEGFPKEAYTILSHTYASVRKNWVEKNPNDPENSKNKQLASQTAWAAVEKAGYKKNKEGIWSKDVCNPEEMEEDTCKKKKDNEYEYINVNRFDVFDLTEESMSEPFIKTPEGYLKGRAIIANTGIQSYQQQDGTILRELRTPEDVGQKDALDSFKNIVITNGHPKEVVNSTNAKDLTVGFTGSDVKFDGHAISVDMTIIDKKTIDDIKQFGKYAISVGYNADIEMKAGFAFGNNEYNAVQKNIRANHVAVNIDRARAGDLARMKFRNDSLDAINIGVSDNTQNQNKDRRMAKIKLMDNVEFEVDEKVESEFNAIKKDNEDLKKLISDKEAEFSKLQANHDSLVEQLKVAKEEIEQLKKDNADESKIIAKVKERIALVDYAIKNGIEVKEDMDNATIRKEVIKKAFPKSEIKLDEKDEIYLSASYDRAVEILAERNTQENKQKVNGIQPDVKIEKKDSLEVIQKRRLKNLWKLTQKQAEDWRNGVLTDEIKAILDKEDK